MPFFALFFIDLGGEGELLLRGFVILLLLSEIVREGIDEGADALEAGLVDRLDLVNIISASFHLS